MIPRLVEKITASFTGTEKEKFIRKAELAGKKPSTRLRELAIAEIYPVKKPTK